MLIKPHRIEINKKALYFAGIITSALLIISLMVYGFSYNKSNYDKYNNEVIITPAITQTPCITDSLTPNISTTSSTTVIPSTAVVTSSIPCTTSIIPSSTILKTTIPLTTLKPTNTPLPTTIKPTQSFTEINIGDTSKKQVIFTFDAGAGTQSMQKILDVLKKYNVTGTFFITGKWAEANKEYIKTISSNNYEIYNHTYNHPYLTKISDEDIIKELKTTEDLIYSLTGKSTKPFFRAPYGDRNNHVLSVTANQGYRSVYWTVDALDWKESSGETSDQVKDIIYKNLKPGCIYLMHIGDNITGQILDEVFQHVIAQGYSIKSLSQGL